MKLIFFILFPCCLKAQKIDTIPETLVYRDMTIKTAKGYSYIDQFGRKQYLSSTKKPLNVNYRVEYPTNTLGPDTLINGFGIKIDSLSPHKFLIRLDTTKKL